MQNIFFGVAVVLIIGGVVWVSQSTPADAPLTAEDTAIKATSEQTTSNMMGDEMKDDMVLAVEAQPVIDDMSAPEVGSDTMLDSEPALLAATTGTYTTYSEAAVASDQSEHKIIFFHAPWCPSCKAADSAISTDLASIPSNLTIFKADYDTETTLRAEYGITLQHSFALLASDGTLVKIWNGSRSVADLVANI